MWKNRLQSIQDGGTYTTDTGTRTNNNGTSTKEHSTSTHDKDESTQNHGTSADDSGTSSQAAVERTKDKGDWTGYQIEWTLLKGVKPDDRKVCSKMPSQPTIVLRHKRPG